MTDPLLILLFAVAFVGGGALLAWAIRQGARLKQSQEDLARRNGWVFAFRPASGGRASETVFSDPAEGWTLTLYAPRSRSGGGGSSIQWSLFEDPTCPIGQGMAVIGPEIPAKTAAMADKMFGMMGGDIGLMLLDKITGGLGAEAQGLRSIAGEGPGHLMASPGAETALDQVRALPALAQARAGRNENRQPIVMRGPFGLRLRVPHLLRKPEDIEAFIALGRALAAALRAG